MATINYNGMELEEFKIEKPEVFSKPRKALCWDGNDYEMSFRSICNVFAVVPYMNPPILTESRDGGQDSSWFHCAFLPDPPKPRRATNRELARWLAQGNGEYKEIVTDHECCMTYFYYSDRGRDTELPKGIKVCKWSDTEWHEPTVDYMGITSDTLFERKYVAD